MNLFNPDISELDIEGIGRSIAKNNFKQAYQGDFRINILHPECDRGWYIFNKAVADV